MDFSEHYNIVILTYLLTYLFTYLLYLLCFRPTSSSSPAVTSPALREVWQVPAVTSPTLREVWQVPAAGPCSDNSDDEDCDVASGSNVQFEVDVVNDPSTPATTSGSPTTAARLTTSRPAPMSLITVQLPPREASVFLDDADRSREEEEQREADVELYESRFSTSLGMNIGLIAGIAAGIIVLTLVVAYAVCKYRSGRLRRLGRAAHRGKALQSGKDPHVTAQTGLLSGGIADHDVRKTTTTPLLYRESACNYSSQKTANGYESDARRKRKDVNEWYV